VLLTLRVFHVFVKDTELAVVGYANP